MPPSTPAPPGAITLDELIALNDEIAALVRARVPLEPALCQLGGDLPGRLGKIATAIAQRGTRGESLSQVLADSSLRLPPVYRAVVEAGLRTGRLSSALEALAGSIRRVSETRRSVAVAALYPLLVLMVAWGFFAFFSSRIAPPLFSGLDRLEVPGSRLLSWTVAWGREAVYWGPAGLAVMAVLAGLWCYVSSRAGLIERRTAGRVLGWLPWIGSTLRWSRAATMVDVLALLIDSRMPLDEALVLAAGASGDAKMVAGAKKMAEALQRGETVAVGDASYKESQVGDAFHRIAEFPPLLRWMMAAGQRRAALLPALRHAAQMYHRRARHQAELARLFLPVVLTVAIGGSVTLLYAVCLFAPYASMLRALGAP